MISFCLYILKITLVKGKERSEMSKKGSWRFSWDTFLQSTDGVKKEVGILQNGKVSSFEK